MESSGSRDRVEGKSLLGMVILHLSTPVLDNVEIRCRIGIQALSQAFSPGAMHDAAERDPSPGTREKITEDIVRWIEEPNTSFSVLWVNGCAGVGKTALMQTLYHSAGIH